MSETAQSLVSDTLQELLVNSAEQAIPAVDFLTGVRFLNRWIVAHHGQRDCCRERKAGREDIEKLDCRTPAKEAQA